MSRSTCRARRRWKAAFHPRAIATAPDDLRAQAARAGVGAVADVRCFVAESAHPHLWCEGVAVADAGSPAVVGEDPTVPIEREPQVRPSRFVISGDGGVGMLSARAAGRQLAVLVPLPAAQGRPRDLRSRALPERRADARRPAVGVGATVLGRYGLGRSRFDAIVGGSALATFQNGATNPTTAALFYHGFAGVAYQDAAWRISGVAQPWVQLQRGCGLRSRDRARRAGMFGLHVGLSSPEQR